jgi:hypothetical protein
MNRKDELMKLINDKSLEPTVDEFLFIEGQLCELKKLPFIQVHPQDAAKQRATPAAKMYKELLQQYTNILKILLRITGGEDTETESPLRRWLNANTNKNCLDG